MSAGHLVLALGVVGALALATQIPHSIKATEPLAHVRNSFEFTVHAPQNLVAPLFGAHRERVWAEGWDPQFLYPQPAEDKAGAVFTINHGGHTSTWITTALDLEKGHVQYAYFIPGAMTTLIDIHLSPAGGSSTHVEVMYERTALSSEVNDHVTKMGEQDRSSADHWQKAIEKYLVNEKDGLKEIKR